MVPSQFHTPQSPYQAVLPSHPENLGYPQYGAGASNSEGLTNTGSNDQSRTLSRSNASNRASCVPHGNDPADSTYFPDRWRNDLRLRALVPTWEPQIATGVHSEAYIDLETEYDSEDV